MAYTTADLERLEKAHGSVDLAGRKIVLTAQPEIYEVCNRPIRYRASGVSENVDGNFDEFDIFWDVVDDWKEVMEESDGDESLSCDWEDYEIKPL